MVKTLRNRSQPDGILTYLNVEEGENKEIAFQVPVVYLLLLLHSCYTWTMVYIIQKHKFPLVAKYVDPDNLKDVFVFLHFLYVIL